MNSNNDAGVRLFTTAPVAANFANGNGPPLAWDWSAGVLYGLKSDNSVSTLGPISALGIYISTGVPDNAVGSNGDFYLRRDGGVLTTIYQRRAGAWVGIV